MREGVAGVRVGCCGFAQARAAYFRRFALVEVQQTFYHPPGLDTLRRWRVAAPAIGTGTPTRSSRPWPGR